jgi:hypothetical protein
MPKELVHMKVGDIDVLIEAVRPPGTEPTSARDADGKVLDAFQRANEVVERAAASSWEMVQRLASNATSPTKFEIEFGLGYSVEGKIIVAGASADANLKVTLTYEGKTRGD